MGKIRGMKEVFTTAQGVVKRLVSAGDMHPGVNVRQTEEAKREGG